VDTSEVVRDVTFRSREDQLRVSVGPSEEFSDDATPSLVAHPRVVQPGDRRTLAVSTVLLSVRAVAQDDMDPLTVNVVVQGWYLVDPSRGFDDTLSNWPGSLDVVIDWGDGSTPGVYSKPWTVPTTHTYAAAGDYTITATLDLASDAAGLYLTPPSDTYDHHAG
jgi:hypothetical protein